MAVEPSGQAEIIASGELLVSGIDLGAPTAEFTLTLERLQLRAIEAATIPLRDVIRWDVITGGLSPPRIDFAYREPDFNRRLMVEVRRMEVSGRTLAGKPAVIELGRLVQRLLDSSPGS